MKLADTCTKCHLCQTRRNIVWGDGPENAKVMFVAEGPGRHEDKAGRPMVDHAKTGKEFNYLLTRIGLGRDKVYVTNLQKCHSSGDKDPTAKTIKACEGWLWEELAKIQPELVVTVGRYATRWFLGDVDMEVVHGIPFEWPTNRDHPDNIIVIPMFHTAAGLHDPTRMLHVQSDFQAVRDVIAGKRPPRHLNDPYAGKEQYEYVRSATYLWYVLQGNDTLFIDTEGFEPDPWSVQFSVRPGEAFIIDAKQKLQLTALNDFIQVKKPLIVLHNALHDLPILKALGINIPRYADTMVMAYLLQSEPQGLKALAYRHCGMEMMSYADIVREPTRRKALKYLAQAAEYDYPDCEPVLEWPKGEPHIRQPRNIKSKIADILRDATIKDPLADPLERFNNIPLEEGRQEVEDLFGPMEPATLKDVDPDLATYYACRDADATCRIYPTLWFRIKDLGLEQTFWIDMNAMPWAMEMMRIGIKADIPYLQGLSDYFDNGLNEIEHQITKETGYTINVGAPEQVGDLLFDKLDLYSKKRTKTGQYATGKDILKRLVDRHPAVQLILDHRATTKLKGTYCEAIPRFVAADGRVHPNVRLTRVATGRLSMADPNLQNQPISSEEGRKIRDGFVAEDGYSIASFDYSQIELRIMADNSGDKRMIDTFDKDLDIHSATASAMFGIPIDQLDKMKHRYPAKRVNFGIPYGITAQGLHRTFVTEGVEGWTVDDCQNFINDWFDLYHEYQEYLQSILVYTRRHGYIKDMWGRIRYIPGVRCKDRYLVEEALRMAGNMPIQAGAQGVIKKAMGALMPVYEYFGDTVRPLIQIHDDLVHEIHDDILPDAIPIIKGVMENIVTLKVPTPVGVEIGKRWGSLEEWLK